MLKQSSSVDYYKIEIARFGFENLINDLLDHIYVRYSARIIYKDCVVDSHVTDHSITDICMQCEKVQVKHSTNKKTNITNYPKLKKIYNLY